MLKMLFLFFKFQAVEEHPLSLDAGGQYDVFSVKYSLKSAFHHIYRYLVEKHYENQLRYLVDKDLSRVQCIVLSVLSTF